MKNLEQYKSRFYNLMESTIGEVKPLITEQEESWKKFMNDVFNILSKQGFQYDTEGRYNRKLPTIQKGNAYTYFKVQYSPTYKRAFWSTNDNNPNIKVTEPSRIDFFVKGENGQEIPQDPKKIQQALKDVTTKYDFSSLPQTDFTQQSTQPAR